MCDSSTTELVLNNEELLFRILDYCNDTTRVDAIALSSTFYKLLTSEVSFKWRVECLHREKGIYYLVSFNSALTSSSTSWKGIFIKNWNSRNLWFKQSTSSSSSSIPSNNKKNDDEPFYIQVSARFKPKSSDLNTTTSNTSNTSSNTHHKKIELPLHQRLALIQMNRGLQSKKEAFKVLVNQGSWFGEAMKSGKVSMNDGGDDDDNDDDRDDTNDNENQNNTMATATTDSTSTSASSSASITGGVHLIDPNKNFAVLVDTTKGLRKFDFDNVIDDHSSQEYVYQKTAMPLITEFVNGFNVSCIVYGQTGSGKTHTMFGPHCDFNLLEQNKTPSSWGIVPRACFEIFQAVEYRKQNLNLTIDTEVAISYVEIYGDSVNDLLRNGKSCGQNKVSAQRYVLDGSSEFHVKSLSDTLDLLNEGESHKRKASTAMNERSSRAHSIFIIRLKQKCTNTGVTATSRLFLTDLGGSEQLKKSQPFQNGTNEEHNKMERKERVREAVNINLGLLALKQCVEARRRKKFVPYADSKLTMMLSSGLGGDSKTAVIVCGAQEAEHGSETIAAMKFGQTCRGISNTARTTANMLQELLQNINDGIHECEENIKKHERWESRDVKHYDDNGNVIDVRKVTAVVGAEKYREQLLVLIRQKMELTGESIDSLYAGDSTAVEGFGNAHVYGLGRKVGRL